MSRRKLRCPTCEGSKPGRCCNPYCCVELGQLAKLLPCPYASDVEGDESLHLLCESCREQRAQDI